MDASPHRDGIAAEPFHVMVKPGGSRCNIDCSYCYFLSKEALYPGSQQAMSDETLEAYIGQLLAAHPDGEVTVGWQGGEPTLMKREFFERALAVVERHRRPGRRVLNTLQTNGLLLDDDWCALLKRHGFLVGLSIDGPREMHDANRVDRRGGGTFDLVMRGWECLRRHRVDVNVLCTVNAANQHHGREVYRFFRDVLKTDFIQFIPIVERTADATIAVADIGRSSAGAPHDNKRPLYLQQGTQVTARSVGAEPYGRFLIDVFEEWVRHDVGRVFVQLFDVTLEAGFGRHRLCIHAPTCGHAVALEHNGDLYSCDHYVEPGFKLGNIHDTPLRELVSSPAQRKFGDDKAATLTAQCKACNVRALCHGGCPKDRFVLSRDGEAGHNYLCAGLKLFFEHVRPAMGAMAQLLQSQRPPAAVMEQIKAQDRRLGPYQPCPCGSGRKLRFCHGERGSAAAAHNV